MISPEAAWEILLREITPLQSHSLPLEQAAGCHLAEEILADSDIPPADRAAMDGYAGQAEDLGTVGLRLTVDGEIAAGQEPCHPVVRGHCIRIFTGANLPQGADTVVPVEQTSTECFIGSVDEGEIEILKPVSPGANVFRRGEQARAGDVLLEPGARLGPRQIGLAAAAGRSRVEVHRRPKVAIVNTGAELLHWSAPASAHQVRNSNGPMLTAALVQEAAATVASLSAPDELEATIEALQDALARSDAVIVTGGISAGRRDFVPRALEAIGAPVLYRTLAMKPGKPQLFARSPKGKPIFGLPGNPLSSIVGLYELVLPALRLLGGCPAGRCRPLLHLELAGPVENRGDRQWICPARLLQDPEGTRVLPCPPVGSADMVTGASVDGAILIEPNAGVLEAGQVVPFRPWGEVSA